MTDWVIEELIELAEQGDSDAQYQLGSYYLYGERVEEDLEKALSYWERSAKQGNPKALCALGQYYFDNEEIALHYQTAVEYWKKALRKGSVEASYYLSMCYFNGHGVIQDYHKAIEHCLVAAKADIPVAQYQLGNYYRLGFQDFFNAAKWYKKAAEQDFVLAQYALGTAYKNGDGVTQSDEKSAKWYEKAAERGDIDAQYNLGIYYLDGVGVERNLETATQYFQAAADQGHEIAQKVLSILYRRIKNNEQITYQDLKHLDIVLENLSCPFCKNNLEPTDTVCACGAKQVKLYEAHYIFSSVIGSVLISFILAMFVAFMLGENYHNSDFVLKVWSISGIVIFIAFIINMILRKKDAKNIRWER